LYSWLCDEEDEDDELLLFDLDFYFLDFFSFFLSFERLDLLERLSLSDNVNFFLTSTWLEVTLNLSTESSLDLSLRTTTST